MNAGDDDVALSFGDSSTTSTKIRHPVALFFHLFFRVSALVLYIFASFLLSDYVELFIVIILLLAFDFWVIKNVTGRLLVGLRWWNKIEEDGKSTWMFESKQRSNISSTDSIVFWGGLLVCPLLWVVFLFTALFSLSLMWMLIPVVGLALNGSNLIGYIKCRKDAGTKIRNMAGQIIGQQLIKQALSTQMATS